MTYHFREHRAVDVGSIDWMITCTAWRGSCLEVYSRAERSVDECIAALESLGRQIGPRAHHPATATRVRALKSFLERDSFSSHVSTCVATLGNWADLMTQRAVVANGTMSVQEDSVTLRYSEQRGRKGLVHHESNFSRFQMLAVLSRLTNDQRQLHLQLCQIKADAERLPPAA